MEMLTTTKMPTIYLERKITYNKHVKICAYILRESGSMHAFSKKHELALFQGLGLRVISMF